MKRLAMMLVALALLQACESMEIKGADEFGYRRTFHPAG